jgi:hypothetical protein
MGRGEHPRQNHHKEFKQKVFSIQYLVFRLSALLEILVFILYTKYYVLCTVKIKLHIGISCRFHNKTISNFKHKE